MGKKLGHLTKEDKQVADEHAPRTLHVTVPGEMQPQASRGSTAHLSERPDPSAGGDVGQQERPLPAGGVQMGGHSGGQSGRFLQSQTCPPRAVQHLCSSVFTRRSRHLRPHKTRQTDAHSSCVQSHQTLEAAKVPFPGVMGEYTVVRPDDGALFSPEEKRATPPRKGREGPRLHRTE